MKKSIPIVLFLVLALIVCLSSGCTSSDITLGVSSSLIKMTAEGIASIDSEIVQTDQQLTAVEQKLLKLDQVVTPATKWVDYQKTISRLGNWRINVTPEELNRFKNDQFQVKTLEFLSLRGNVSSTIEVTDLTTGTTQDWKSLQDDLTALKNNLVEQRTAKVEARKLPALTVNNALKYLNEWKIEPVDDVTYVISGIGLGWEEKLTTASWTYYKTDGKLVPRSREAENLKSVLSAR